MSRGGSVIVVRQGPVGRGVDKVWEVPNRSYEPVYQKAIGESGTEIPVESLCIHNEDEVRRIETIRGTFRRLEGNSLRW
jgi:hypothetical protein